MANIVVTALYVVSWYTSNIGVVLLNKYLLSFYGYKYPVVLTMCHMIACTLLGLLFSTVGVFELKRIKSVKQFGRICFLAVIFATTVVLSNISLRFIPVSFNQAIGATTPVFTAVLAFLIQGKHEQPWTYAALLPVVLGIVTATGFEPSFEIRGFTACTTATALRALKSVVQAVLLSETSDKMDSLSLLTYMAPAALLTLMPAALFLEPTALSVTFDMAANRSGFIVLIVLNSLAAFFANLLNFLITKHTSALTLQVLGNAKGVVAAIISVALFQNPVSYIGMLGYAVTVGGMILYTESKKRNKPAPAHPDTSVSAKLLP